MMVTTFFKEMNLPEDLKKLSLSELTALASSMRDYMLQTVADNGGHLSASLGVVELSLALHYHYQSPKDKIIWDVGHQSYPHKLLTGRWQKFPTLRCKDGLCGFPKPAESAHDPFGTGHSSTSISAALGLSKARDLLNEEGRVIAVIGDGALTGGMAYEALNHAGHLKAGLTVILNDNKMSISSNVGSMAGYLSRIRSDPKYSRMKKDYERYVGKIPLIGAKLIDSTERLKGGLKYLIMPGMLFEELGFTYLGPVDGHNIEALLTILKQADKLSGPVLVHVVTEKGKGYRYAEKAPDVFHGIGPFDLNNGLPLKAKKKLTYTDVFGSALLDLAQKDDKIVAITAAMTAGTGLKEFSKRYPERFFDVGIAEQHAVTMAAALAAGGLKPVFAVYSTFLQRAFDQVLHDACIGNLPVVFAVDRAGIVGEDGETHQGLFDLSFLRCIPNMTVLAPADEAELKQMLSCAFYDFSGPVALRYPRDKVQGVSQEGFKALEPGRGELVKEGSDLLIIAAGTVLYFALQAAERLLKKGLQAAVLNARFVKPLDEELIIKNALRCGRVLTVEENVLSGGFGSAVLELFEKEGLMLPVKRLGVQDIFVGQGSRAQMLKCCGLDAEGIYLSALNFARAHYWKEHI